mmetsp:Transcript_126651/g.364243  ORF Transcript_126651/g.364243 Transcript_126651/m.364243 type:complete len:217 (+) Transcript_126651:1248-1898(+)
MRASPLELRVFQHAIVVEVQSLAPCPQVVAVRVNQELLKLPLRLPSVFAQLPGARIFVRNIARVRSPRHLLHLGLFVQRADRHWRFPRVPQAEYVEFLPGQAHSRQVRPHRLEDFGGVARVADLLATTDECVLGDPAAEILFIELFLPSCIQGSATHPNGRRQQHQHLRELHVDLLQGDVTRPINVQGVPQLPCAVLQSAMVHAQVLACSHELEER